MKPIFLSAGIGLWYSMGVDRLGGSLIDKGWTGDLNLWKDQWPNNGFPRECIYTIKPAAFQWAIDAGFTTLIWGDASVTAIRNPQPLVDHVDKFGYWIGQSGYNCAQVCSDKMLTYFGVSRDDAEKMPDAATGLFGVNLKNAVINEMILTWIQAGRDGAFAGSRLHDGQSSDPRYLHHRQDQAAMSVIAWKLGVRLDVFCHRVRFKWDTDIGQEFHCEGM